MSKINQTIAPREDFHELSFKEKSMSAGRGISVIIGQLKSNNNIALQSIEFRDGYWDKNQISDWMKVNLDTVKMAVNLPDVAAGMWMKCYDDACIDGNSGEAASEIAWNKVKEKYYQDKNGQWIKFSEDWKNSLLQSDRPTIEIFRVGKYPQLISKDNPEGNADESFLDKIVSNSVDHNIRSVVTNDHRKDGPAFGMADRIFRVGNALYATLSGLVTDFTKAVKAGRYINRSVEMALNYDLNGIKIGPVLTAISFLGAKPPQVKGMALPSFTTFNQKHGVKYLSIDNQELVRELNSEDKIFGIEITDSYVRIRQKDPSEFQANTMKTISMGEDGKGIKAVVGKQKNSGSTVVQSYLFDKEKFTVDEAKAWVKDHGGNINMNELETAYQTKGEITLEISEKELQEKIESSTKKALADNNEAIEKKFKEEQAAKDAQAAKDFEAKEAKLKKEAEDAKAEVAKFKENQLKIDTKAKFDDLLKKGKILPSVEGRFVALFQYLHTDSVQIEFADGKTTSKGDPAKMLIEIFESLPDQINLSELTKNLPDKNKNPNAKKFADADPDSLNLDEKIRAHMQEHNMAKEGEPNFATDYANVYAILAGGN